MSSRARFWGGMGMLLDAPEQFIEGLNFFFIQIVKGRHDPGFVLLGHVAKGVSAFEGEADAPGAAVLQHIESLDQALAGQLVGDGGDVATGDHHAPRQLVHLHAVGGAPELRHQVKAGQGGVKLGAQLVAHLLFNQLGTGEQAQPQPQSFGVLAVGPGFQIHGCPQRPACKLR